MAIYRKVALERLSSPDQLDQLMQVTTPRGWLALWALVGLLAVALGWGVYGSIPSTAVGEGILIRRGGVTDLVATGSGQVEELLVQVGDVVEKGEVVARVRQESMERGIAETRARLEALATEYQELSRYAEEQKRLSARNRTQEQANLELNLGTLQREEEILEDRLAAQRDLLTDGLITQETLLATEQQLNDTRNRRASMKLELDGLELRRLEADQALDQQLEVLRNQRRDLDLRLREQEASLEESSRVVSSDGGRVLEITVDRGDLLSPGTQILSMEVVSEELMAVVFVPAEQGKQVSVAMAARIAPSTAKREEYGYMLGEVVWVSEFPSTSRGMMRLLANQELVTKLMAQGPPIQIDVRLEQDPATPTGYRWSSSTGPDLELSSGTLAAGDIIIKKERPISLLIPKIRETLGI